MSTKVASLYAEIGADTTGLKKGLAQGKTSMEQFKKQTDSTVKPLKDFTAAMSNIGMAVGVAAGALYAAKTVFDFGKEGAMLELTKGKFDRLATSIGTVSDALMTELREATRGTVSDAQLLQSATDFMSLGLAKTHDQVVRLTRVAGALGMNMNQLVLTLTNQTTMRFDALGVAVDGFDARVTKLKATGMDANAAFTEAFLQQAEAQIAKVGEVADTSAGAFMRLEAATANLSDALKMKLAPPLADAAGALATLIAWNDQMTAAVKKHGLEVAKTSSSWEEYITEMVRAIGVSKGWDKENIDLATSQILLTGRMEHLTEQYGVLNQASFEAAQAQEVYGSSIKGVSEEQDNLNTQLERTARLLPSIGREGGLSELRMEAGTSEALRNFNFELEQTKLRAGEAKQPVQNIMSLMSGELSSPMAAFIKDLQWFEAGGWRIEAAFNAIKEGVASGAITPEEGKRFTGELLKATEDIQVELGELNIDEAAQNISDALGITTGEARQYILGTDGIQGALEAITGTEWVINVKVNYIGTLPAEIKTTLPTSETDSTPIGWAPPSVPALPETPDPNARWGEGGTAGAQSFGFGGGVFVDGIFIDGGGQDPEAIGAAVISALYDGIYTASRAGVAFSGV